MKGNQKDTHTTKLATRDVFISIIQDKVTHQDAYRSLILWATLRF